VSTRSSVALVPLFLSLLACGVGPADETASSGSTSTAGDPTTTGTVDPSTSSTGETTGAETEGESDTTEGEGNLFLSGRTLNIAHRGGGLLRPESTLIAFKHALEVGADVLEFDVHASSDGVLVAIHDDTVDRTTEGVGEVRSATFEALQTLDAGYHFTADDGMTFPYRQTGVTIPSVESIFTAFPDAYYSIEIKQTDPPIADALVELIHAHGLGERTIIASFDTETIVAVRAIDLDLFTSMSIDELLDLYDNIGDLDYPPAALFIHSPWELTTQEFVDYAHALELKVQPWTVNSPLVMDDMIAQGVDGIMTDDPELLAERLDP